MRGRVRMIGSGVGFLIKDKTARAFYGYVCISENIFLQQ